MKICKRTANRIDFIRNRITQESHLFKDFERKRFGNFLKTEITRVKEMKREYREVDRDQFVTEEKEKLTKTEREHIKKQFYESTGITTNIQQKKKYLKWYYVPAACAAFGLCVVITPIGNTTFAKALKSFVGIGEYLGKTEEDTYVTHVDQEKQGKDITITLKDVIASNQQLRCSVLVTNKDKTKTKLKDVQIEDIKINNKEPEENRGYAVLGKENVKTGNLHFVSVNYKHQEMLLNPKISLQIRIKNNLYHFKFMLKNQKFKKAEKNKDREENKSKRTDDSVR